MRGIKKTAGVLTLILMVAVAHESPAAKTKKRPDPEQTLLMMLTELQSSLQLVLEGCDQDMVQAAGKLSGTGLTGAGAQEVLQDLFRRNPYAVDFCAVDAVGHIVEVEPSEYLHYRGADISAQEHVIRLQQTRQPVLSSMFRAVEGFLAVDLQYPVLSARGEFMGAVSMLIRLDDFLPEVIVPKVDESELDCWLVQTDGRVLYDSDPYEIGRNVLRDPLYRSCAGFAEAAGRIMSNGTGRIDYTCGDGPNAVKAAWESVGLHGTEWRMVMATRDEKTLAAGRLALEASSDEAVQRLQSLAGNTELQGYMIAADEAHVAAAFETFCANNPGIRAVRWIDAMGIDRVGYPPESGLKGYNYRKSKLSEADGIRKIVEAGKADRIELRLLSGDRVHLCFQPVRVGWQYLGLVYGVTAPADRSAGAPARAVPDPMPMEPAPPQPEAQDKGF